MHMFWAESRAVCVFLWGGHVPPHVSDLYHCPPWGLSVPLLRESPVGLFGVCFLPPPCIPCAGSARCSRGVPYSVSWFPPPPSLAGMPCAGCACCRSVGPSLPPYLGCSWLLRPPTCTLVVRTAEAWGPLPPPGPVCALGSRADVFGLCAVGARFWAAGWGSPPSFPPLETAHVKCARPFGGSPASSPARLIPRAGSARCWVFPPAPPDPSIPGPL